MSNKVLVVDDEEFIRNAIEETLIEDTRHNRLVPVVKNTVIADKLKEAIKELYELHPFQKMKNWMIGMKWAEKISRSPPAFISARIFPGDSRFSRWRWA